MNAGKGFKVSGWIKDEEFKTVAQYDSAQRALPVDKRDRWVKRTIKRKE